MIIDSEKTLEDILEAGMSDSGGWSAEQLKILGEDWPPKPGWKLRTLGKEIEDKEIERFIRTKNDHLSKKKKQKIAIRTHNLELDI
jgi:hypothetical protein